MKNTRKFMTIATSQRKNKRRKRKMEIIAMRKNIRMKNKGITNINQKRRKRNQKRSKKSNAQKMSD